jgi:hypothetical protein
LAATGSKRAAQNSGIFSDSGKGQRPDPQAKASFGKQASQPLLNKAIDVPMKKALPKSGVKGAAAVASYASKKG